MERFEYPIRVAICGLGPRGRDAYGSVAAAHPELMQIVAIADPDAARREEVRRQYNIPQENCFETGEAMFACEKLADMAFICTQDQLHVGHAVAAMEKGYHLLLEKPVATTVEDVRTIEQTAIRTDRTVVVCHVLRYAPFFEELKASVDRGDIGDVVCIQALENVHYWHQAHSYVRGNWRSEKESSFMLLAKCCHDLDYLVWLCGGGKCARVSSFGSLKHFRPECAPEGAAMRCAEGCKVQAECPYDAEKIYLTSPTTGLLTGHAGWPCSVLALNPTEEKIREALRTGPYGRCVYHCDNDVVDNQIVNMEMENGIHCQLMMTAFTARPGRCIRIMGTKGTIEGDMDEDLIRIEPFGKPEIIVDINKIAKGHDGHGGGDARLVMETLRLMHEGKSSSRMTTISASTESHYIAFAAEQSRRQGGAMVEVASVRK